MFTIVCNGLVYQVVLFYNAADFKLVISLLNEHLPIIMQSATKAYLFAIEQDGWDQTKIYYEIDNELQQLLAADVDVRNQGLDLYKHELVINFVQEAPVEAYLAGDNPKNLLASMWTNFDTLGHYRVLAQKLYADAITLNGGERSADDRLDVCDEGSMQNGYMVLRDSNADNVFIALAYQISGTVRLCRLANAFFDLEDEATKLQSAEKYFRTTSYRVILQYLALHNTVETLRNAMPTNSVLRGNVRTTLVTAIHPAAPVTEHGAVAIGRKLLDNMDFDGMELAYLGVEASVQSILQDKPVRYAFRDMTKELYINRATLRKETEAVVMR